jgi:hypothetical protein
MNELKAIITKDDYDPAGKYKADILRSLVHAADIGNPSRPYEISKLWALKILGEFFDQVCQLITSNLIYREIRRETWV